MNKLLELSGPQDSVLCTGTNMSLLEFVQIAFDTCKLDIGTHLEIEDSLKRANDLKNSIGNPHEAEHILGWSAKIKGADVVHKLLEDDIQIHDFRSS